jgi:hypothetical protein
MLDGTTKHHSSHPSNPGQVQSPARLPLVNLACPRHRTMTPLLLSSVMALFCGWTCQAAGKPVPLAGQVHVVSVHVPDHANFDAVYRFFHEVLELPLIYGTPSKPGYPDERLYAGFSVGNAYLEPCGPYASDAPFTPDKPARFHGLTFAAATALAAAAPELSRRRIAHSGILGSGDLPRFVYSSDPLLTGKFQAVGLWEILDKENHANLSFLSASLKEAKGGALGVKRLEEVRIGYPSNKHLEQWSNFLKPSPHTDKVWTVGNGPKLRFVPAQETQIEAIVLKVESLTKAKRVLEQKGLVGNSAPHSVELNPAKSCGLRIVLVE